MGKEGAALLDPQSECIAPVADPRRLVALQTFRPRVTKAGALRPTAGGAYADRRGWLFWSEPPRLYRRHHAERGFGRSRTSVGRG